MARALGLLFIGILIARALMLLRFTFTGHHFLLLYTPYTLRYLAAAAGVLASWELWQVRGAGLLLRLRSPQRLAGVVAGVVAVGAVVAVDSFARIDGPATMAQALSQTEFGKVDALVLNRKDAYTYTWNRVEFRANAFDGPQFSVRVVTAVRSSRDIEPAQFAVITRSG